jgi:phosphoglycolate phosphatase
MSLAKPKAILFDWDNTLVDTWPLIHHAFNVVQREFSQPLWSLAEVKTNATHSMRDAFPKLFGAQAGRASIVYQEAYRAIHLQKLQPITGAKKTLDIIAAQSDIYCALVSNKRGESLREEVTHLGWDAYFSKVIGSGDAARDKPNPDTALLALEGSPLAAGDVVWFIGDTVVDLQCAAHLGAKAVLYGNAASENQQHAGAHFDVQVHDHTALQRLLSDSGIA